MSHKLLAALLAALCLTACAERKIFDLVPDTNNVPSTTENWPKLVPASQFKVRAEENKQAAEVSAQEAERLEARAARLRSRAARMNRPILSNKERAELRSALKVQ